MSRAATCDCGTCRKCYERWKKRRTRARHIAACEHPDDPNAPAMSIPEIAATLGVSHQAVSQVLARGLRKLAHSPVLAEAYR